MLVKQQKQMAVMMKRMRKMGKGQMMGMMKNMMGGKADELELMAQSMDADALGEDMESLMANSSSPIGPNPFGNSGLLPGLGQQPKFPIGGHGKKR